MFGHQLTLIVVLGCMTAFAQTGSMVEPVRYMGGVTIDPNVHDGRLRPPIGTLNTQVLRVNRTHPERDGGNLSLAFEYLDSLTEAELLSAPHVTTASRKPVTTELVGGAEQALPSAPGWTYNHAPMIAYWNDTFYVEYLSNPVDEHIPPGQTLISTSKDGIHWERPSVIFPHYEPPAGTPLAEGAIGYMMHQRMGFYVAPNGRLLVLAFYGHAEDPFLKGGIGRVVREAYKDGSYGPIYFIRYSTHTDWNESNTSYPFYKRSEDAGFIEACDALLADKLKTLQWMDEDQGLDGFYQVSDHGEAFSYYTRPDGVITGFWKRSTSALSTDGGITFSPAAKCRTFLMAGGKQWAQRTDDGRYAIAYNPIELDEYRYPLAVVTGEDGIHFDDMLVVHAEVPPRRFMGRWKDFGPCYTRGIIDGNGEPPGNAMWLTYSVNKEDIWVGAVPTPIRYAVEGPVNDTFDAAPIEGAVPDWNIYRPLWAPVAVVASPTGSGNCLRLEDRDPYDYAKAVRVFQEGTKASVSFNIMAAQNNTGMLDIEVLDRFGSRPVRVRMDNAGNLRARNGHTWTHLATYAPGQWIRVTLEIEAQPVPHFSVLVDDKSVLENAALTEDVYSIERIAFRTGEYRDTPRRTTPNQDPASPLPGADDPVPTAAYCVDEVEVR